MIASASADDYREGDRGARRRPLRGRHRRDLHPAARSPRRRTSPRRCAPPPRRRGTPASRCSPSGWRRTTPRSPRSRAASEAFRRTGPRRRRSARSRTPPATRPGSSAAAEAPERPDGIDADAAAATIAEVLAEGGGWLVPDRVAELLAAYGVPQVAATVVRDARRGRAPRRRAAAETSRSRRSRQGWCTSPTSAESGSASAAAPPPAAPRARSPPPCARPVTSRSATWCSRWRPRASRCSSASPSDPDWGPVVACAAGGRAVELLGDVQSRLAPLSRRDAGEMLRSLRTFPLLDGYRGAPRSRCGRARGHPRADRRARRRAPRDRRARLQPGARRARTARRSSTRASGSRRRGRRGPIRRSTADRDGSARAPGAPSRGPRAR